MNMDHMDMSDSSSASNPSTMHTPMNMNMVFTTAHSTALYSSAWTPKTTGAYAGTCIFIIVLGIISRMLLAYRHLLQLKWNDQAAKRRYIRVAGESGVERSMGAAEEKSDEATLTTRGMDERVRVVKTSRNQMQRPPWRFSTDLPRACIYAVEAGVGYLLMLAVMTLNVGYFLSAIAGLFVGELACGRYIIQDDGHH